MPKDKKLKEQDGDMSRFHQTKFPFAATINGTPVIVWPDWIEYPETTEGATCGRAAPRPFS
jgi:hypothetical protein